MDQEEYLRELARSNIQCLITLEVSNPLSGQTTIIERTNAKDALNDYLKIKESGSFNVLLKVEFSYIPWMREFTEPKNDAWEQMGKEAMLNAEKYRNEILENEEFPVQCAIAKLRGVGSPCIDPAWLGTNVKAVDICRRCMENSLKWLFSYAEGE